MLKSTNGLKESDLIGFVKLSFTIFSVVLLLSTSACSSSRYARVQKEGVQRLYSSGFGDHHSGLLVIDPENRDTLMNVSGARNFIPASNVKIVTLYTALKLIPEELPIIKYRQIQDTIYFEGLGYPASLHPHFHDSTLIHFLKEFVSVRFKYPDQPIPAWPNGWSWEDFDQAFAAERNGLPLYGNSVTVRFQDTAMVHPAYFKDSLTFKPTRFHREKTQNRFYYSDTETDSLVVPMFVREGLSTALLGAELGRELEIIETLPAGELKVLKGIPRDTVLQEMMIQSDNFLAEQLLLQASLPLSDSLDSNRAIDHILEKEFPASSQPSRWVDGSGLSRYNLFSPTSIVHILERMYAEFGEEYTLTFFPVGGVSGTLDEDFVGNSEPYVFAKSGSMGNVYCLSGYLRARSGKILIFSFMNNNFTNSQVEIKQEMNDILAWIRDTN